MNLNGEILSVFDRDTIDPKTESPATAPSDVSCSWAWPTVAPHALSVIPTRKIAEVAQCNKGPPFTIGLSVNQGQCLIVEKGGHFCKSASSTDKYRA